MHLRQLEYVVAACEEGSFTAAARRCHVAQPSLSSSIASLERELGAPLFHRVGRSIRPTSACDELLPVARDALRSMDAALAVAAHRGGRPAGRIDLAVQPSIAATLAVSLIRAVVERYPGVTVRMVSPDGEETVADLVASGRSEVGLGERSSNTELRWLRIASDSFVLLVPAGMAVGEPPIRTLDRTPTVAAPSGTPSRVAFDEICAAAGVRPEIVVEAEPRDALVPLVAAGVGAAVLPASAVPGGIVPGVEIVPLSGRLRAIGLLTRRAPLTPAAEALRSVAREWNAGDPAVEGWRRVLR